VAVANPRYRRSQSTGADRWVDHHSPTEVPLNTILKPAIKGAKRSVTKLSEKEIFHEKTTRYCLTSQEQDTDGEVETKLYKVNKETGSEYRSHKVFEYQSVTKLSGRRISYSDHSNTGRSGF
jgi:hypothetical protein